MSWSSYATVSVVLFSKYPTNPTVPTHPMLPILPNLTLRARAQDRYFYRLVYTVLFIKLSNKVSAPLDSQHKEVSSEFDTYYPN